LKEIGYPLISDDALSLGYSRSVHFVISFMEVLHTDQRLKRYEAAYLFHRIIRKENPTAEEHEALRELCTKKGLDSFLSYFAKYSIALTAFRMRQLTVFELSELLMQTFGLFENQTENEYLFRFLDVVLEFGTRRSNHLGDFLQHWETAKNKLSITIPSDTDALRITTIHKSKGLEYPVVIVPYANWKVTPNAKLDRLWIDLEDIPYDELTLIEKTEEIITDKKLKSSLVSVVKDLENTLVSDQYLNEKTRTLVENLNLLYVAFTRPVQRLYVLAKREKNWNQSSQVSNWMHDYISQENFEPSYNEVESKYVLSQGDENCFHAHSRSSSESFIIDDIISNDRTDSLRLRRMAERIFDVETFERKKDHLQKMRHLLIMMNRAEDMGEAAGQLVRDGIVTREEAKKLYLQLTDLFKNESLKDLYSEDVKVQVNKELLLPGGKMLHVDRVVQLPDESYVFMSFVAGIGSDQSRQHLKRLVKVYTGEGKPAAAMLLTLENDGIEWIL